MEKDLTIIIPTYNDTMAKIKCTLDSIAMQKNYDFNNLEIIIVDDNSSSNLINWNETLNTYSMLNIKIFRLSENKGPGLARQVGLDNASGKFIYFLDLGDSLYNSSVLAAFNSKKNKACDIISTKVHDEETKYKRISFMFNNAYIFGIFIKKEYISSHNIHFSDILRWEEDAYFEDFLRYYYPKVIYLKNTSYSYNAHKDSITRKNNHEYQNDFGGFSAMIVKHVLLCDFYQKEKRYDLLYYEVFRILATCYARFYPYFFQNKTTTERIMKILFLLKLLIQKCDISLDLIHSNYFREELLKRTYERKYLYNNMIPYDKIDEFMDIVLASENTFGNYMIEGTNITIDDFINRIIISEDKGRK